jgi:hypothetical protein
MNMFLYKSPGKFVFLSDGRPAYYWFNPSMVFPKLIWRINGILSPLIVPRHAKGSNHLYWDLHMERYDEKELYKRGITPFKAVKTIIITK